MDIARIIDGVLARIPDARWQQLPGDPERVDCGLWFLTSREHPGQEVQLESSSGMCPFLVEHMQGPERFDAETIDEAVAIVVRLLTPPR